MDNAEAELERAFEAEAALRRARFGYTFDKGRAAFDCGTCAGHEKTQKHWLAYVWAMPRYSLLVAPVIYSLTVPLVMLDAWLFVYQALCFPVYGIAKVERSRYILLDRGGLRYLNWLERLNCDYCGYANGLIDYAREIASRTEQYFCPIKHATRCAGTAPRYALFAEFGDADAYHARLKNKE